MKKNSWHYKLAKIGNQNQCIYSEEYSICEYSRKVMLGGLLFLLACAVMTMIIGWFGWAVWEIVGFIFGFAEFGPAAAMLLGFSSLIGLMALHHVIKERWQQKSRDLLKKDNDSFIANTYKSYKDKICFPAKFED